MPSNLMKNSTEVESLQDLADLLNTIRYWGVDVFPNSIVKFALTQEFTSLKPIHETVEKEISKVKCLLLALEVAMKMEMAMKMGEIEIVRHLEKEECVPIYTPRAIALAAEYNRMDCLQHAIREDVRLTNHLFGYYTYGVFNGAVANGHLSCIKLLQERGFRLTSSFQNLACVAAAHNQLECLQYLQQMGCAMHGCAAAAASTGSLMCLEYVTNGVDTLWYSNVCDAAVRGDHLHCLALLHKRGCRMSLQVGLAAATAGALNCLKYYIENGGELHSQICSTAALHDHFVCLEYAHSHGCPLTNDRDLVKRVIMKKYWKCAQFLIQHNCYVPRIRSITIQLMRHHKDKLLRLAVEHGCKVATEVGVRYARRGNLEGLKFALENGSTASTQILTAAARKGHLECLTYAHQHGCKWNKEVCEAAARGGHVECLQYAREHGCAWDVTRVRRAAAKRGYELVVAYANTK